MFAGVTNEWRLQAQHPPLLVFRAVCVPGYDQGVHVGDAAPRGQDAVPLTPPNNLPHLQQHVVLHHDEHGGDLVGEHVGVGRGREPLPRHGHDIQSLGQLVEEVWVTSLHLVPDH